MLIYLSFLGIFLSLILLVFNVKNYRSAIYLGSFFFLISLYSLTQYVLFYSKSTLLIGIFFINPGFLAYLIGPMIFWYVRSILTDNYRLTRSDLWHFLPMVIFLIASLPHIMLPWPEKIAIANKIITDPAFIVDYNSTLFYGILPGIAVFMSRPILVLVYTLWAAGMVVRYSIRSGEKPVFSRQLFMKKWLYVLLGSILILVSSSILLLNEANHHKNINIFLTLNILQAISGTGLITLLISPFLFPSILYGLPLLREENLTGMAKKEENQVAVETIRHAQELENEYLVTIGMRVDSFTQEFRPYLQPDFNMTQLSAQTRIPVHHLAFYFKEIRKEHFSDYRNKLRIEHAKELIRNGNNSGITLDAIGTMCGFSSRNTFFKTFKKVEGRSPGSFASQLN